MATWILVGGFVVLALILGGALLLVLMFTRDGANQGIRLPRFKRLSAQNPDEAAPPPTDN